MKAFICFFLLFVPCLLRGQEPISQRVPAFSEGVRSSVSIDSWFGKDKARHLVGSFLLTGAGSWMSHHECGCGRTESVRIGMSFAFSLGLAKEFWDIRSPEGRFSWKDLVADFLGVSLGGLLIGWW